MGWVAVGRDGGEPAVDLAVVGVGELEGQQDRLGCDAAGAGLLDRLVEGIFGEAVEAFDAVAEPEVDALPLGAAVGEGLVVLGSGLRRMVIDCWAQILAGPAGGGGGVSAVRLPV